MQNGLIELKSLLIRFSRMLNGDDELDAILSMMGGGDGSSSKSKSSKSSKSASPSPAHQHGSDSHSAPKQKTKKKKKKRKKRDRASDVEDNVEISSKPSKKARRVDHPDDVSYADTRLKVSCFGWPAVNSQRLLLLGKGLAHSCEEYASNLDGQYGSTMCTGCGKSGALHELWRYSEEERVDPLSVVSVASILVAARNVRCLVGEYYPACPGSAASLSGQQGKASAREVLPPLMASRSPRETLLGSIDGQLGRVLGQVRKMQAAVSSASPMRHRESSDFCVRSTPAISHEDVEMLRAKTTRLVEEVQKYKASAAVSGEGSRSGLILVERRLAVMAACDGVYYRCYYSVLTSRIPDSSGALVAALIPHPPTYFSCPNLAWDVEHAGLDSLRLYLGKCKFGKEFAAPLDDPTRQMILSSWGLRDRLGGVGNISNDRSSSVNPLLALWQSRFIETIRHLWVTRYSELQTHWALSSRSRSDEKKRKDGSHGSELDRHEAEALSPAMVEWRDSTRDYPAHFMAYAVPTPDALEAVLESLVSSQLGASRRDRITSLVEAGAGTGYWSALLQKSLEKNEGLSVVPYDIAPPSRNEVSLQSQGNEYHGEVPCYTPVGQSAQLEATTNANSACLLLCYPPPESEMAHDALASYLSHGGRTVMHIGEWQGLTGSASFETLLKERCICIVNRVVSLPCWGTDAAYLTVWNARVADSDKDCDASSSPAIGYCSVQECKCAAVRRSLHARMLQYCSQECFEKHSAQRQSTLALHMLYTTGSGLEFDDDKHFIDISCSERQGFPVRKKGKKKKKRRKS